LTCSDEGVEREEVVVLARCNRAPSDVVSSVYGVGSRMYGAANRFKWVYTVFIRSLHGVYGAYTGFAWRFTGFTVGLQPTGFTTPCEPIVNPVKSRFLGGGEVLACSDERVERGEVVVLARCDRWMVPCSEAGSCLRLIDFVYQL